MSANAPPSPPPPGKYWWVTLFRSLFAFGLGLSMLWSNPPQAMFVNYMGFFWLSSGITSIAWGMRGAKRKGLWMVSGIIGTLGGAFVLMRRFTGHMIPVETAVTMFGIVAVLTGLMHMFGGFRKSDDIRREWSLESFILGVVEVGLGILLFFSEAEFTPVVRTSAILWALAGGTSLLLQSLRLRRQYQHHSEQIASE